MLQTRESGRHPRAVRPAGGGRALAAAALLLLTAGCRDRPSRAPADEVLVFAAASLSDALRELAAPFQRQSGLEPVFNFAGSNVLAQQIDSSPVADVFLSADAAWMDWAAARRLLVPGSRRDFLSNRLAVVAHPGTEPAIERLDDLAGTAFRHLVLADPGSVPAGRYARAALEAVTVDGSDLWTRLAGRVVPAPDIRAALGLIEATPDSVGIVYRSDLGHGTRVRLLLELPAEAAPPIRYVAAAIAGRPHPAHAEQYLKFLERPASRELFARHGFLPVG